jgi:pimeloyl-ACP methyl ester carboxylesterase
MQLVRVIEVGMDADGEGIRDVDPSRIYYFGFSMGGIQGAAFAAVEPRVRAAVLNAPGAGGDLELSRLCPLPVGRQTVGALLQSRVPSLINSPGITSLGGISVGPPQFDENIPLRGQPSVINSVAGAMEIQGVIENTEWVRQSGNPAAYAPHLRKDPLVGVPAKPVIIQFARGDRNIVNLMTTVILRAGDLADRATLFRTDLAFAQNPTLLVNYPHRFMIIIDAPIQVAADIALGAQGQIASFFASDGQSIIHPEPAHFFEVPIASPLPEDLFFLP